MGTTFHVTLVDSSITAAHRERLPAGVDSVLKAVNAAMSTYQQDSEISRFNRWNSLDGFDISSEFSIVMAYGLELCGRTDGAFDVTVAPFINFYGFGFEKGADRFPTVAEIDAWLELTGCDRIVLDSTTLWKLHPDVSIDLSAIAKGFGSDAVCRYLQEQGYQNVFAEVGGEITVSGHNATGKPWRIGVDRPMLASQPGEALQHILTVSTGGVATSGDYRNYREIEGRRITHMIDPRTGYPIDHSLASVTIVAENCMLADGYATAVMVMGLDEGLSWLESLEKVEGLLITRGADESFQQHMTSGFAAYIGD
jgi:thiamine biosynthesis lipoprotein